MSSMLTPGRIVLASMVLGLGLRLAFGLGYWVDKPLTHDEREYLLLATNLAAGRGFTQEPGPPSRSDGEPAPQRFGRAPVYPIFVALVTGIGQAPSSPAAPAEVPAALKIAQSIVGTLGVWLIALIARRIGGPRAGAYAALIAAAYPPLIWICAYALSEALYSVVALASAYLVDRALDRSGDPARPGAHSFAIVLTAGIAHGATGDPKNLQVFNDVSKAVNRYPLFTIFDDVNANVKDGVVTLTGWVTMSYKRGDIEKRVAKVGGVQLVRNEIQELPVSRLDDQLRYRIARAIYTNPNFWNYAIGPNQPIHIVVEHSRVTLTGTVQSEVDKALARSIATGQFGVMSVTNNLKTEAEVKDAIEKAF
jgi:hypothetical protein